MGMVRLISIVTSFSMSVAAQSEAACRMSSPVFFLPIITESTGHATPQTMLCHTGVSSVLICQTSYMKTACHASSLINLENVFNLISTGIGAHMNCLQATKSPGSALQSTHEWLISHGWTAGCCSRLGRGMRAAKHVTASHMFACSCSLLHTGHMLPVMQIDYLSCRPLSRVLSLLVRRQIRQPSRLDRSTQLVCSPNEYPHSVLSKETHMKALLGLSLCSTETLGNVLPVHNPPDSLEVVWTDILVL